jgi:hypothetical protein
MTSGELGERLETIVGQAFEIPEGAIVLRDDLDLWSLGDPGQKLQFIALIEANFGVAIDADVPIYFGELVRMIESAAHSRGV